MIIFPTSVDELIERLRALLVINSFLFEETILLPQTAKKLVNVCVDNRSILEARTASDKFYLTMLTLAIDKKIYLWSKFYCKAVNVTSLSVDFMNFTTITLSIELNNFHYAVPSPVQSFRPKPGSEDKDKDKDNKKKMKNSKRVFNEDQVEESKLRPGESYDTVFKHKVKEGPKLSMECKGCHKWHNQGWSFDDCLNEKSHKKLTENDAQVFRYYCK